MALTSAANSRKLTVRSGAMAQGLAPKPFAAACTSAGML
jgi:hypothetical protein